MMSRLAAVPCRIAKTRGGTTMSRLAAVPCRNATTRGCTPGSRVRREPLRGREARRRSAPDAAETAASRVRPARQAAQRAGYARAPERGNVPLLRQRLPRAGYAECVSGAESRVRRALNQTRSILLWLKYQFVRQRESSR